MDDLANLSQKSKENKKKSFFGQKKKKDRKKEKKIVEDPPSEGSMFSADVTIWDVDVSDTKPPPHILNGANQKDGSRVRSNSDRSMVERAKADDFNQIKSGPLQRRSSEYPASDIQQTLTLIGWDLGQASLNAQQLLFLASRAIYLVAFDLNTVEQDPFKLEYWLQAIHVRAPEAPIILVGYHSAKTPRSFLDNMFVHLHERFASRFPRIRFFLPFDGSRPGLLELQGKIVMLALQTIWEEGKIPSAVLSLAEKFEALKEIYADKPLLTLLQFESLASSTGLVPAQHSGALFFLTQIGTVLHFHDTALMNVIVVDALWLWELLQSVSQLKSTKVYYYDYLFCLFIYLFIYFYIFIFIISSSFSFLPSPFFSPPPFSLPNSSLSNPTTHQNTFPPPPPSPHTFTTQGILVASDFEAIWRPPRFPKELYSDLLGLLEKFELAYRLPSSIQVFFF